MPYAICDKYTGKPIGQSHDTETDAWFDAINRKLTQQVWMNGETTHILHPNYEVTEVEA